MKKIKLGGKLNLNKETVTELNNDQMGGVLGGNSRGCGSQACGSALCPTQQLCVTNKGCYVTDAISACQSKCGDILC
jgi:hypothetical protein